MHKNALNLTLFLVTFALTLSCWAAPTDPVDAWEPADNAPDTATTLTISLTDGLKSQARHGLCTDGSTLNDPIDRFKINVTQDMVGKNLTLYVITHKQPPENADVMEDFIDKTIECLVYAPDAPDVPVVRINPLMGNGMAKERLFRIPLAKPGTYQLHVQPTAAHQTSLPPTYYSFIYGIDPDEGKEDPYLDRFEPRDNFDGLENWLIFTTDFQTESFYGEPFHGLCTDQDVIDTGEFIADPVDKFRFNAIQQHKGYTYNLALVAMNTTAENAQKITYTLTAPDGTQVFSRHPEVKPSPFATEKIPFTIKQTGVYTLEVSCEPGLPITAYDFLYFITDPICAQNLRVTGSTLGSIHLAWDHGPVSDGVYYQVMRKEGNSNELIPLAGADVWLTQYSYVDDTVKPGATYTYAVYASKDKTHEDPIMTRYSNEVKVQAYVPGDQEPDDPQLLTDPWEPRDNYISRETPLHFETFKKVEKGHALCTDSSKDKDQLDSFKFTPEPDQINQYYLMQFTTDAAPEVAANIAVILQFPNGEAMALGSLADPIYIPVTALGDHIIRIQIMDEQPVALLHYEFTYWIGDTPTDFTGETVDGIPITTDIPVNVTLQGDAYQATIKLDELPDIYPLHNAIDWTFQAKDRPSWMSAINLKIHDGTQVATTELKDAIVKVTGKVGRSQKGRKGLLELSFLCTSNNTSDTRQWNGFLIRAANCGYRLVFTQKGGGTMTPTPTGLAAKEEPVGTINLTWNPVTVPGKDVYYQLSRNGAPCTSWITDCSITDTTTKPGETVTYAISAAVSAEGESKSVPSAPLTVTAIRLYTLTVTNGTGSCTAAPGTQITVTADTPQPGSEFRHWSGDTEYASSTTEPTIIVTMPAKDIKLHAQIECYAFEVNVAEGWNLMALDFTPTPEGNKMITDIGSAFEWRDGHFIPATSFVGGRGFWLHAAKAQKLLVPWADLKRPAPLATGWNIIHPQTYLNYGLITPDTSVFQFVQSAQAHVIVIVEALKLGNNEGVWYYLRSPKKR